MSMLATISPIPLPTPATPIAIRPAHLGDLSFIDSLQKMHTKAVGFMPTKSLEQKIAAGHVIVAEEVVGEVARLRRAQSSRGQLLVASQGNDNGAALRSSLATGNSQLATPLGYAIAHDQYFKRDDVGIIYQLNVLPTHQRGLIGAHLLKAVFDRAAYGCRLFCCWCAQDLAANRFWEAMGFVPLAFRSGGRGKGRGARGEAAARVHIFWQKRIREGDTGQGGTPWWFPCQTTSGSIREDRLVLPIPPGVQWWEEMPLLLPQQELPVTSGQLPERTERTKARRSRSLLATGNSQLATPAKRAPLNVACGLRVVEPAAPLPVVEAKAPREPRRKVKNDPRVVAAARELRDRWLEKVNSGAYQLAGRGRYDLFREQALPAAAAAPPLLDLRAA